MVEAGQTIGILAKESLEKIGDDITKWCDTIENCGLVDYALGVGEDPIIDSKHIYFLQKLKTPTSY